MVELKSELMEVLLDNAPKKTLIQLQDTKNKLSAKIQCDKWWYRPNARDPRDDDYPSLLSRCGLPTIFVSYSSMNCSFAQVGFNYLFFPISSLQKIAEYSLDNFEHSPAKWCDEVGACQCIFEVLINMFFKKKQKLVRVSAGNVGVCRLQTAQRRKQ